MGSNCFTTTPYQVYASYFEKLNLESLTSYWTTIQLQKIKKVFETHSSQGLQSTQLISLGVMTEIFSELKKYQPKQIQRLYQVFHFSNKQQLDWENFLKAVSVCQFAPLEFMALLMFILFDEALTQKLNREQLQLLIDLNMHYIKESQEYDGTFLYEPEEIPGLLLPQEQQQLSVEEWLKEAVKIFDFQKYRQFFNIFVEERIQKELIRNFQEWNQLYSEESQKYVSYLVDWKWFQSWKEYVFSHYGARIISATKSPNTLKTIKTFKSLKTKKSIKTLNSIKSERRVLVQSTKLSENHIPSLNKNFDLVHHHIGSKPLRMLNKFLQGEYEQVLAPDLVENMHYVLVSEKIWRKLKYIYNGYPQFRRTGYNSIQLYPKRVHIYSQIFRHKIDYSSQVIREVSGCTTVFELMVTSLGIQPQTLNDFKIFFKTTALSKWEELPTMDFRFSELSTEVLIFFAYFIPKDADIFRKVHCKVPSNITQVNLGDQIKLEFFQKGQPKKAIYMGETQTGKAKLHFKGLSYLNDILIEKQKLDHKASIVPKNKLEETKIGILDIPVIGGSKTLGFVCNLIVMLFSDCNIRTVLAKLAIENKGESNEMLDIFIGIYKQMKRKMRIQSSLIAELITNYLPQYENCQFAEVSECYMVFMALAEKAFKQAVPDTFNNDYGFTLIKKVRCLHCNNTTVERDKFYSLEISIPDSKEKYFEFTFVPFSSTLKSEQIKKFGFKLKHQATWRQYKGEVCKLVGLSQTQVIFCEVYGHQIIRNLSKTRDTAALREMKLTQNDSIFVFQLFTRFDKFVSNHYTQAPDITLKNFVKGNLIDCRIKEDKWQFGKIIDIQFKPYTQKTLITVQHRSEMGERHKRQKAVGKFKAIYQLNEKNVSTFPCMSYKHSEQYHVKLNQRFFNEALNEMQTCNFPLVMVLTSWMRLKQLEFLIYQQIKAFIAENYSFRDVEENLAQNIDYDILPGPQHNYLSKKQNKKQKIKRFKDYMNSSLFPYTFSFLDLEGRCFKCHKVHKTVLSKGENDYFCTGCKISEDEPISWQVNINDLMVCVDWVEKGRSRDNIVKDHKSFTDTIMNKKNQVERLEKLVEDKLSRKVELEELLCCNYPYETIFSQRMKNYPSTLVIEIERMVEDGEQRRINRKNVNFPLSGLKVGQKSYYLTSVIAIEGIEKVSYKDYVMNQIQQWFELSGENVQKVKKNTVQKCCALFLSYRLSPCSQSQIECPDSQKSDSCSSINNGCQEQNRHKMRKLTINDKLEGSSSSNEFQYGKGQDQVAGYSSSQQSIIDPPMRSQSKRSARYIKNSKQLIRSVSECNRECRNYRVRRMKDSSKQKSLESVEIPLKTTVSEDFYSSKMKTQSGRKPEQKQSQIT